MLEETRDVPTSRLGPLPPPSLCSSISRGPQKRKLLVRIDDVQAIVPRFYEFKVGPIYIFIHELVLPQNEKPLHEVDKSLWGTMGFFNTTGQTGVFEKSRLLL